MKSWTDYLKVYLHLCLLPGLWQGASDFSGFGHGHGVLSSDEFREEALDRVRLFAEECDSLQVACHVLQAACENRFTHGHGHNVLHQ